MCVLFLTLRSFAGNPYQVPAGARQAGMGSISVMKGDFWSSFHNQAALAFNNTLSFGFSYENRFGIKEMGTRSVAASGRLGHASLGVVYSDFGYSDFSRHMAGIACGLPLSEKVSAGIQIDYLDERSYGEYNNKQTVTFEAGLIARVNDNTTIGIHLFNPVPNSLRESDLVSTLEAGIQTTLGTDLLAGFETVFTTGSRIDFRTGLEYLAVKNVRLRGGFRTVNTSFSFGVGYSTKPFTVDIAFSTHENLGITSCISIVFKIK